MAKALGLPAERGALILEVDEYVLSEGVRVHGWVACCGERESKL